MAYTKVGPFNNGAAPYLSKATMDTIEEGISRAADTADAALSAANGASSAGLAGTVALDSFTGASDDAKLTAALSYVAAQSFIPTILLANRSHTFAQTRQTFSGMKISGQPMTGWINAELASGKYSGARVNLQCGTGNSSWLVGPSQNYDGYLGNIGFVGTGTQQLFHHPLANGTAYCWEFHGLSFVGVKYIFGNTTDQMAITACSTTGQWTVIATGDTPFNLGGSDNDLWITGTCNLGPDTNDNGGGKYLFRCISLGKSNIGGIFFTADAGWRALYVDGSTSYGPALVFNGLRVEGRNPTDPSYGALIDVHGSNTMFRDCWISYGMSNPSAYTDKTDPALVHVYGTGDAIFDGVTYDRASTVSQDAPYFRVDAGAALEVQRVRTCTRGGSWSAKPVVSQATAGQAVVDSSVRVVTA